MIIQRRCMRTLCVALFLLFSGKTMYAQTWETLADIPEKLAFPVVTVVNGKIHVMGGGGASGASTAHYAYDPATDKWEFLEQVPYPAQQPAGAANNGKIHYFGGGYPKTGQPVNSHFIYNPDSNTWTQGASLVPPRAIHYAVSLNDKLYSLAGQSVGTNQGVETLCQVYDEATDMWITKNKLPDRYFWYGAHVAANGKMYRFGGGGYTAPVSTANEYDPETDTWTSLPDYPIKIHAVSGAAIGDKIFLAGGYQSGVTVADMWMFDTKTKTYSKSTPMPVARNYHFMVAIDSVLYSVGGNNNADAGIDVSLIRIRPSLTPLTVGEVIPQDFVVRLSDGRLNVRLPEVYNGHDVRLQLFDLMGRQLFSGTFAAPDISAIIGSVPPSVYMLTIQDGENILTKKIIAQE